MRAGRAFCLFALGALIASCSPKPFEIDVPGAGDSQQQLGFSKADFVLVDKSDRLLLLYKNGRVIRTFNRIAFGDVPFGHKQFEGDEKTPEGRYIIDGRNPNSAYHLSLHISYPNSRDQAFAAQYGKSPGGAIYIHGQPNGSPLATRIIGDWTDGCIALSDAEIEDLWHSVDDGTPIEIRR